MGKMLSLRKIVFFQEGKARAEFPLSLSRERKVLLREGKFNWNFFPLLTSMNEETFFPHFRNSEDAVYMFCVSCQRHVEAQEPDGKRKLSTTLSKNSRQLWWVVDSGNQSELQRKYDFTRVSSRYISRNCILMGWSFLRRIVYIPPSEKMWNDLWDDHVSHNRPKEIYYKHFLMS